MLVTPEELARRERAVAREKRMVIRKGQVGQPEVDFSPVRGEEGISLSTRLTIESFSLAGMALPSRAFREVSLRFVPQPRR